ncbi:MAG: hypothetical protein AAF547_12925 [Actinomycetota bacterium]
MTSSTLQFIVAGALIAAWAWMLGRPVLINLVRRSRRDSVGHFRYQQAVLGRPLDQDPAPRRSVLRTAVAPVRAWWRQPIERRRLQIMLAFAFATFASMLLAIALRGGAVRLFLTMLGAFLCYLCYAALIGAAQLRRAEAARHGRADRAATDRRVERRGSTADRYRRSARTADLARGWEPAAEEPLVEPLTPAAAVDGEVWFDEEAASRPVEDDIDARFEDEPDGPDLWDDGDLGRFGTGQFDEDFFRPIPELRLDSPDPIETAEEAGPVSPGDDGRDVSEDQPVAVGVGSPDVLPVDEPIDQLIDEPAAGLDDERGEEMLDDDAEPTFTTPPVGRPRTNRRKARPIYIESSLDEDDTDRRVVND